MKIVYFIAMDKFTVGYINFMKIKFPQHQHTFFVWPRQEKMDLVNKEGVYYVKSWKSFYMDSILKSILKEADKIIITGMFGIQYKLMYMPGWFTRKTYIQFWGGDFYGFRGFKWHKGWIKTWIFLKRCHGFINLIENDRISLASVFPMKKKSFVAPVPGDPQKDINYQDYPIKEISFPIKILVGNSSTKENQHIEAYNILSKFKNKNIEIYSPLSYGDSSYRDYVIEYGKNIFGKKYHPIVDFMPTADYVNFLYSMDVGVFNNNRQQALGNIYKLLGLGKKVYIRDDTSMWNSLKSMGFILGNISTIINLTLEKIPEISPADIETNKNSIMRNRNISISQWDKVFKDEV